MYKISNFDKSSRHMYIIIKILSIWIYMILIPIIIFSFTMFIKSYLKPNEIPSFLGYKSFVIVSKSMEPTIMTGDAILTKKVKQENLKVNDIISFVQGNEIITHRIVDIVDENGTIKYKTKGDNNKNEDKEMVSYEKIEGEFQFKLDGFGNVVEVLKNKLTLVILLILLIFISFHQVRISKKKLNRKEKRYRYNKSFNNSKIS